MGLSTLNLSAQNLQKGTYGYLYCHMSDKGEFTAYALSRDGLHYHDLNEGKAVMDGVGDHYNVPGEVKRDLFIGLGKVNAIGGKNCAVQQEGVVVDFPSAVSGAQCMQGIAASFCPDDHFVVGEDARCGVSVLGEFTHLYGVDTAFGGCQVETVSDDFLPNAVVAGVYGVKGLGVFSALKQIAADTFEVVVAQGGNAAGVGFRHPVPVNIDGTAG